MSPITTHIIAAKYQIFCAIAPGGRVMQVWGIPDQSFPEVIATDYPDPDTCATHLVCATNNHTEAHRAWRDNAKVCRSYCSALRTTCHTINPQLED